MWYSADILGVRVEYGLLGFLGFNSLGLKASEVNGLGFLLGFGPSDVAEYA